MNYQEKIKDLLQWMYETVCDFAGSSTYDIPYEWVNDGYQIDLTDKDVQDDIKDIWASEYLDLFQAMDFDDLHQKVYVMTWKSNRKKKYTLKNWQAFCDEALICPPFEDEDSWQKWIDEHKIQIIANNCEMVLDYDADAINEIEFSLREIYNAILGDGAATTGNTVGSEYRQAELKDVVRYFIMCRYEQWGGLNWFDYAYQAIEEMKDIQSVLGVYEHARDIAKELDFKCNWHNFKVESLKDATEDGIKKIVLDLVGSNLEISYDPQTDKSFIIDYTFKESGDFIDWGWGNLDQDTIDELVGYYKEQIFEED